MEILFYLVIFESIVPLQRKIIVIPSLSPGLDKKVLQMDEIFISVFYNFSCITFLV